MQKFQFFLSNEFFTSNIDHVVGGVYLDVYYELHGNKVCIHEVTIPAFILEYLTDLPKLNHQIYLAAENNAVNLIANHETVLS